MATACRILGFLLLGVCTQFLVGRPLDAREVSSAQERGAQPSRSDARPAAASNADVVKGLAGEWKAAQYKMERVSQLDIEVFGPHASDIRNVDLTIQPSGRGVLKVSTSVVDQKGRTHAPSVIEAKLTIRAPETPSTIPGRIQPVVVVESAEERYLDGSGDRWPRDGSRVTITADAGLKALDLRYEPKNGTGSFVTTLTRPAAKPAGQATPVKEGVAKKP